MARVKKPQPTLDSILYVTPEQRLLKLLLTHPTTSFTLRNMSSKLKGTRGLGGAEGINRILSVLEGLNMVQFVDNRRSVRLNDEHPMVKVQKTVATMTDLEGLQKLLEPISSKGILFGVHATGEAATDSSYEVFVVTDEPDQAKQISESYPLEKKIEVTAWTPDNALMVEKKDKSLAEKLSRGVVLWGPAW